MVNGMVEKTRNHISPASIESVVPDAPLRTVSAHEGGAYTLAYDRYPRPAVGMCTTPLNPSSVWNKVDLPVLMPR